MRTVIFTLGLILIECIEKIHNIEIVGDMKDLAYIFIFAIILDVLKK